MCGNMAVEFPDEDLLSFLVAEGIDTTLAASGVSVLPSQELFEQGLGRRPAEDLQELPLDDDVRALLATKAAHPRHVPLLRRAVAQEASRLMSTTCLLDMDIDGVNDVRQGVGELLQNAMRYAGGVERVDMRRTASGKLYVGVHNLAPDYPDGPVLHEREGRRPLVLGRTLPRGAERESADDQHGWGTFILGRLVLDRGAFEIDYPGVSGIAIKNKQGRTIGSAPLRQLVVWNLYGQPADDPVRPLLSAA